MFLVFIIPAMRSKTYSIFYLMIMVIYLISPFMPFVDYAINKEYIAKNLCVMKDVPDNCCQGNCYLHEWLNKSSEPIDSGTDDSKKSSQSKKVEVHLKSEEILASHFGKVIPVINYYCPRFIDSYIPYVFVPPN